MVLIREQGKRILIGDDIIIEVLETQKSRVKLGITAPEDILILREELADGRHS